MVIDQFGRTLDYLRSSLTDRCNLRCIYCMPQRIHFQPTASLMTDEEIYRLTTLFAELGFKKFSLTGGEPTVRAGILEIVHHLSHLPIVHEVEKYARFGLQIFPDIIPNAGSLGGVYTALQQTSGAYTYTLCCV